MTISKRIKTLRIHNGLTQTEFARKLNSGLGTIQSWEYEKSIPKVSTLQKIADTYNISFEWLANGTGAMRPAQEDPELDRIIQWITSLEGDKRIWFREHFRRTFPDYRK